MKIWGINKKYKALSWWENFMGGHLSIGNLTIFGSNSMCWTIQYYTKRWGYVCITLPSWARFKRKWDFYIYFSPNATPWACTMYIGTDKNEKLRAKIRNINFGHAFNTDDKREMLRCLNNKFYSFHITEFDMDQWKLQHLNDKEKVS